MPEQPIDLSSGLVPNPASAPPPGGMDLSSGMVEKEQSQAPPVEAQKPGLWDALTGPVTTEGLKDMGTGALKAAGQTVNTISKGLNAIPGVGETLAPSQGVAAASSMETPEGGHQQIGAGLEAAAEFMLGDEALKGLSLADKIPLIGKAMKSLEEAPSLLKNVLAHMTKTGVRTGTVGGVQALAHGATPGEALEAAATTGAIGAGTEGAVAGVSKLLGQVKGGAAAKSAANLNKATKTAEDLLQKAEPLQEAGEKVQADAKSVRAKKGSELGAAKKELSASMPKNVDPDEVYLDKALKEKASAPDSGFVKNPFSDKKFEDLDPDQAKAVTKRAEQLKVEQTGQIPFPKKGNTVKAAKAIQDSIGDSKLGLKDPDNPLSDLTDKFLKGKDQSGKPLSFSFEDAEKERQSLNTLIKTEKSKMRAGGNGSHYHDLVKLKSAFDDDLYDSWEQHGNAAAAQKVRALGKEYAGIVNEQSMGPAKSLFKNQSPEKIVSTIVSGGAKSQSAVESLMKNISPEGQETLRDSSLRELYRRNTLPDGNLDMAKVQKQFSGMGGAGKSLFGPKHAEISQFLDAAAKEQASRVAKAATKSVGQKAAVAGAGAAGAAGGGLLASVVPVPGATVAGIVGGGELGARAMDSLIGKSGAVRIGISPTEKIVLSPAQAAAKRPLVTKFLKSKTAGNTAAMASAYNALAGNKNENSGDEPRGRL